MAIQYVGSRGAGRAGSTSSVNVAINSGLTGGIGSAALAGDLVVVTVAVATQGRNPECGITGYTQKTQQHTTTTTYDISVRTSYKIMPGTPDTQVTIPATGNIADGQAYEIHVFRGVDATQVEDVAAVYSANQGTNNRPDPGSITPSTPGTWLYAGGGGAAATGTTVFTAAYLSGFISHNGADTNDGTAGAGYYSGWVSGPVDGAVWGGGSVNAANSWGCTVLALRPAANIVGAGGDASTETQGSPAMSAGVDGGSVASAEAHGAQGIAGVVFGGSVASEEAHGQPTVEPDASHNVLGAGGDASAEAHGQPALGVAIAIASLSSAEAHGSQAIAAAVAAFGIPSAEAHGAPSAAVAVVASGLASGEAHGAPTVSAGIEAAAVASAEGHGSPSLGAVIEAQGLASEEAHGEPFVGGIPAQIVGGSTPSGEAHGTPTISAVPVAIAQRGSADVHYALRFPWPANIQGAGGTPSAEAHGRPTIALAIAARASEGATIHGRPAITLGRNPRKIRREERAILATLQEVA